MITVAEYASVIATPEKITTYRNHSKPNQIIYSPPKVRRIETKGSIIRKSLRCWFMEV
tara:strand:- start:41 stop:214 length:174 start_codon:yes stop_codon:yes gene_type:complete